MTQNIYAEPGDEHALTRFRIDLLVAVAANPGAHAAALRHDLQTTYRYQDIPDGSLYPALNALEDDGLIREPDADDLRRIVEITPKGERALTDRLEFIEQNLLRRYEIERYGHPDGYRLKRREPTHGPDTDT